MAFIWNRKNAEHIAEHGIVPAEAEHVVLHGKTTYQGDRKWLARGQTAQGRYVQVIYVMESDAAEVDYADADLVTIDDSTDAFYVIHARPLTSAERSALKRKRKGKR